MLGLINDILDLSKVEAGKLSINAEEAVVETIIGQVQLQFAPVAKDKGLAFPVIVADDAPQNLRFAFGPVDRAALLETARLLRKARARRDQLHQTCIQRVDIFPQAFELVGHAGLAKRRLKGHT